MCSASSNGQMVLGDQLLFKKNVHLKRQRSCFSYNAPGLQKLREKESQWELKVPSNFIALDFYDITILIAKQSLACKTCSHDCLRPNLHELNSLLFFIISDDSCSPDWLAHDPEENLCPGTQLCPPHHCPHHQSHSAALHGVSVLCLILHQYQVETWNIHITNCCTLVHQTCKLYIKMY